MSRNRPFGASRLRFDENEASARPRKHQHVRTTRQARKTNKKKERRLYTVRLLVKKSFDKKSDTRGPGFLKRLSVLSPISYDTPSQSTQKNAETQKSGWPKWLGFQREFVWSALFFIAHLSRGSRPDPAKSKFGKHKTSSGDTRAPPKLFKTAPSDKTFG